MNRLKKVFPLIYITFLLFSLLYVRNIITTENLDVKTKDSNKIVEEVKPVKVSLLITGLKQRNIHKVALKNTNTFDDLLEDLVKHKHLTYEKTEFTYGTEYDDINGEIAPEGYVWRVFADEKEITHNTKGIKLIDKSEYILILEKL